jgi:uncharacterized protein YjeT (DUF2065 family)
MVEAIAVALGLVFGIEGLIWALAPDLGRRLAAAALQSDETTLRISGTIAVAFGVLLVWLFKG